MRLFVKSSKIFYRLAYISFVNSYNKSNYVHAERNTIHSTKKVDSRIANNITRPKRNKICVIETITIHGNIKTSSGQQQKLHND